MEEVSEEVTEEVQRYSKYAPVEKPMRAIDEEGMLRFDMDMIMMQIAGPSHLHPAPTQLAQRLLEQMI